MGGEEFLNATMDPLLPMLRQHGYSDKFITEIVAAATRVNYGQYEDMNAFAGTVYFVSSKNECDVIARVTSVVSHTFKKVSRD